MLFPFKINGEILLWFICWYVSFGTRSVVRDSESEGDPSSPTEADADVKSVDASPTTSPAKPSTGQAAAATLAEAGHTLEGSEADLVILPLRLAFETKQSKLVEPALDCLHVRLFCLYKRVLPLYSSVYRGSCNWDYQLFSGDYLVVWDWESCCIIECFIRRVK